MKPLYIFSLLLSACTIFATVSSAQLLLSSNMENMDWPLNDSIRVGNRLYADDGVSLAVSGQKGATLFVADTTAYLDKVQLPLTQVLFTNKSNPDFPDSLWPFGDAYQYENSSSYEVGVFENAGGQVGKLLEKTQVESVTTFPWEQLLGYPSVPDFDYLPFSEAEFSNTTLLQAGQSYFLGFAAASEDWGYMYWWNGEGPGDTIIAQTLLSDLTPLESDWGWLASNSDAGTSRAYRIFGSSQGSIAPEPSTYGVFSVLLLVILIVIRRRTYKL
ncbi:hypothetical protein F7C95_04185 [Opitutia bacterium ISCC 51]|nr:hypothetical protein F7C95_04185 [Opitutae bacterium ISCC 51]QXD29178.1 hypothetical protein GA003_04165 [Opitutae bacterium ISCC 52]